MKLSVLSGIKNSTIYLIFFQVFMVCVLWFTITNFGIWHYYLVLIPAVPTVLILITFIPESIPYFLITANYIGFMLFSKYKMGVSLTDIFILFTVLAYLCSNISRDQLDNGLRLRLDTRSGKVFSLLLLLFLISILSTLINLAVLETKFIIVSFWYLLKMARLPVAFYIFSKVYLNKEQVDKLFNLCLILAIVQLPIAAYQSVRYAGGVSGEYLSSTVIGTMGYHHSMLGTFMLIPFFVSIYRFLKCSGILNKLFYAVINIFFLSIIIMSGCRSALLGLAFSILLFVILNFRIKKKYTIYMCLTIIFAICLYFFSPLNTIINSTFRGEKILMFDLSTVSRFIIWKGAWEHFISADIVRKIIGIGIGAYPSINYNFTIWDGSVAASGAHNNLLHILCEIGILGLLIYLVLFFNILKELYKSSHFLSKLFFFTTIALLVSGIGQETFWLQKSFDSLWVFYLIMLSLVFKYTQFQNNQRMAQ